MMLANEYAITFARMLSDGRLQTERRFVNGIWAMARKKASFKASFRVVETIVKQAAASSFLQQWQPKVKTSSTSNTLSGII